MATQGKTQTQRPNTKPAGGSDRATGRSPENGQQASRPQGATAKGAGEY
jgi:hypothetical protein